MGLIGMVLALAYGFSITPFRTLEVDTLRHVLWVATDRTLWVDTLRDTLVDPMRFYPLPGTGKPVDLLWRDPYLVLFTDEPALYVADLIGYPFLNWMVSLPLSPSEDPLRALLFATSDTLWLPMGLELLRFSLPSLMPLGTLALPSRIRDVAVTSESLYVATDSGLVVLPRGNPAAWSLDLSFRPRRVAVGDTLFFAAFWPDSVAVYRLSNRSFLRGAGVFRDGYDPPDDFVLGLAAQGERFAVLNGSGGYVKLFQADTVPFPQTGIVSLCPIEYVELPVRPDVMGFLGDTLVAASRGCAGTSAGHALRSPQLVAMDVENTLVFSVKPWGVLLVNDSLETPPFYRLSPPPADTFYRDVYLYGNGTYLATAGQLYFRVWDISDPTSPQEIWSSHIRPDQIQGNNTQAVVKRRIGSILYLVDLSTLTLSGNTTAPCDVRDFAHDPPFTYGVCGDTLFRIDWRDPSSPQTFWITTGTDLVGVDAESSYVVVVTYNGVALYDTGFVNLAFFPLSTPVDVALEGGHVFALVPPEEMVILRVPDLSYESALPLPAGRFPTEIRARSGKVLVRDDRQVWVWRLSDVGVEEKNVANTIPFRILPGGVVLQGRGVVEVLDLLGRKVWFSSRGVPGVRVDLQPGVYVVRMEQPRGVWKLLIP